MASLRRQLHWVHQPPWNLKLVEVASGASLLFGSLIVVVPAML
jgi:hypothetical protein